MTICYRNTTCKTAHKVIGHLVAGRKLLLVQEIESIIITPLSIVLTQSISENQVTGVTIII